ncbi:SDR family oxidoreductase [Nocardia sp. NBC_01329]|uniref:SDR family oxidoreductase n=1 Tax=Nocardia sp. NBC_01329 TaxID=2903594 RepID=UPI002E107E80|nr:SDR family oxidoreductase [Nocardia sp. NBC_01329]
MVTKQWGEGVIVTGAAGGIGAAIAAELAGDSAHISLWDRDSRVHEVAARLGRQYEGTDITSVEVDVSDAAVVAEAFDKELAERGAPRVVVHAAGSMIGGSALDTSPAEWQRCVAVNTNGAVYVAQRAAREMVAAGRGSIVVVSSNSASVPRVNLAAYGAAKAAASAFTRSLALQVAPHGVRVNLVSPGSTDTPMLRGMYADSDDNGLGEAGRASLLDGDPENYRLGIPLRRIADPTDIAAAVRFLVSDAARHITMHDLRVDGGATLDM